MFWCTEEIDAELDSVYAGCESGDLWKDGCEVWIGQREEVGPSPCDSCMREVRLHACNVSEEPCYFRADISPYARIRIRVRNAIHLVEDRGREERAR